jgi:prolipoprotein diacylglyceryltransferase
VALNWDYFREHPNETAGLAGMSEHAAILGGLVGWAACHPLGVVSRRLWAESGLTAHSSLPTAFILIILAASIGCIPNGCAYGREVFWQIDGEQSLAWLLRADWPDATLVNNPRWPAQALLAGWMLAGTALLFFWTWWQGDKVTRTGQDHLVTSPIPPLVLRSGTRIAGLSPLHLVIFFAFGDFLIQFLRGDPALMPGGLRIYQWFDVALAGLAAILLIARQRPKL